MITLHGEKVEVGDKVWHVLKGWGEVYGLDDENSIYPICVQWEEDCEWFTKDGKLCTEDKNPILFWQPFELESLIKPKQKEKMLDQSKRIKELEDMLFARGAMEEAPCFCCGYNGPGYYQPDTHPCAKRHHKLTKGRRLL